MRAALRSRLERLEVVVAPKKPRRFRSGVLKTLPKDYVGERHVVIVKREPSGAPGNEWCEFEERPGPAPLDAQEDDCTTIYIRYEEREIPQWPKSAGREEGRANRCVSD
jgi:hypothetical protein